MSGGGGLIRSEFVEEVRGEFPGPRAVQTRVPGGVGGTGGIDPTPTEMGGPVGERRGQSPNDPGKSKLWSRHDDTTGPHLPDRSSST